MADVEAIKVAAALTSVAACGSQLAAVFHKHSLIAKKIPRYFEAAIITLDATVTVLKQALDLVNDEATGKRLFSLEGLTHMNLLVQESANTLAKVQPTISEACVDHQKAKRKPTKRAAARKLLTEVDPLSLNLVEADISIKVEQMRWSLAKDDLGKYMDTLHSLQLHLLLVSEVIKVGALSKEFTAGKVDVQSIVASHDRINRIADLIGIKKPRGRRGSNWRSNASSSSDSDSGSESSDNDASSISCRPKRKLFVCGPPPPPPPFRDPSLATPAFISPPSPPVAHSPSSMTLSPSKQSEEVTNETISLVPTAMEPRSNLDHHHPPEYSESGSLLESSLAVPKPSLPIAALSPANEDSAMQLDEKRSKAASESSPNKEEKAKPAIPENLLVRSFPKALGSRIGNFFRSKQSLSTQLDRVLKDSESQLLAFIIHKDAVHRIPHSAFHSLEATHMKTILSQLNSREWYDTFKNLDMNEHHTINSILHQRVNKDSHERELVVLKVLEQKRLNAWVYLIARLLRYRPSPDAQSGRVLLAIVREKLVHEKASDGALNFNIMHHPTPPPHPLPTQTRSVQASPGIGIPPKGSITSDLSCPLPPPGWGGIGSPTDWFPTPPSPRGPPLPPGRNTASRISDLRVVTELDARTILTTFNEYTLRLIAPPEPGIPVSWLQAKVTQETNDKALLLKRITDFQMIGRNTIDIKLRLTGPQNAQVRRIIEDLGRSERDHRFEWIWVEISLHNKTSDVTDLVLQGNDASVTTIHLIAKRSPKSSYKALDVYNALMSPPPRMPLPPSIINPHVNPKKGKYDSSDSDSSSTCSSSGSSTVGNARKKMRKCRTKKSGRGRWAESDGDTEDEEEDGVTFKLQLKRGDDIVKILLDKWTAEVEGKGKGNAFA